MPGVSNPIGAMDYQGRGAVDLMRLRELLVGVFGTYGFSPVEPGILESAALFLERSGEELRRRMYVFADPGGRELCLRPDLTLPTCRLYAAEQRSIGREARLCYAGPVFRYEDPSDGRYRQFQQAGAELFGCADAETADAEMMGMAMRSLGLLGLQVSSRGAGGDVDEPSVAGRAMASGLVRVRMGDLGLIHAFVEALPLADRWRGRLLRHLRRLSSVREVVARGAGPGRSEADRFSDALGEAVALLGHERSQRFVEEVLSLSGLRPVGSRTAGEIADRLLQCAVDRRGGAMASELIDAVEGLMSIRGRPAEALARAEAHARGHGIDLGPALRRCERRLGLIRAHGVDVDGTELDLGFHRGIEYYTGFIFEVHHDGLGGASQLCGGGRYDRLLRLLGTPDDIPAVGFAFGVDRLLLATRAGAAPRPTAIDAVVVAAGDVDRAFCVQVAEALRRGGWRVRLEVSRRRLKAAIAQAAKEQVPYIAFVGEAEASSGRVRLKDLRLRREVDVTLGALGDFVAGEARGGGGA